MNKPTMNISISGSSQFTYDFDLKQEIPTSSSYNLTINIKDVTAEQHSEFITRIGYVFKEICWSDEE